MDRGHIGARIRRQKAKDQVLANIARVLGPAAPFHSPSNSREEHQRAASILGEPGPKNPPAFPGSARHGLYKGRLDLGFGFVRLLEWTHGTYRHLTIYRRDKA